MAKANTTSAKKLERATRLGREIELRRMGFSYTQIAAEVGVNRSTVCRDILGELKRLAEINDGRTLEHRELELLKLDALEREMHRVLARHHCVLYRGQVVHEIDARSGEMRKVVDDGPTIASVRELRAISERRSRLLGLDTAQRLEHVGAEGGPIKQEWDFSCLSDEELEREIEAALAEVEGLTEGARQSR